MVNESSEAGRPRMVDVGGKEATVRSAVAEAFVSLPPEAARALDEGPAKGDALRVAELAGITGAKQTSALIPLCHPLPLDGTEVRAEREEGGVRFTARCRTRGRTGVEMEAMTAVSVASLTLYDMLKSASKAIEIGPVRLASKEGGKSGPWSR